MLEMLKYANDFLSVCKSSPSMALKSCIFYFFRTYCWTTMADLYVSTRNVRDNLKVNLNSLLFD